MGLIPTTQQVEMEFKVRFLNLNIPKIREEVEENRKRKLLEEDMNSQHIASLREKRLKALDKVIEKIDDIEDTDYQIWNELAKTIAEITKSVNSK